MPARPDRRLHLVDLKDVEGIEDYAGFAHLVPAVEDLKTQARALVPRLRGRRLRMVNSTAQGGGVAEMLPKLIRLMRDLGVEADWTAMAAPPRRFFELTKRLHNLIHGVGDPRLGPADRELYEAVSRNLARALRSHGFGPSDLLVIHDPQPLGAGALLKRELGLKTVWRCHIGLDESTAATRAAWTFLKPYASAVDHCVFTAPEYIPDYLAGGRSSIITPGLDPRGPKNRVLTVVRLNEILAEAGLEKTSHPVLGDPWTPGAERLRPDGRFAPARRSDEIGLGVRPTILQVSRWDALKGWSPLLRGFVRLKARRIDGDPRRRKTLQHVRLVMAGPDPGAIQDDPEARDVLNGLVREYRALPRALRKDVAIVSLPMASRTRNALLVNALQRCATIVAQNSLREGFGLTATEAMWKRAAVLGTRACGLRMQIRDGFEGRLASDPTDPEELAGLLEEMLLDGEEREAWGVRAQRRVYDNFLIFTQVRKWLTLLADVAGS